MAGGGAGLVAGIDQVATVLPEREARLVSSSLSRLGLLVVRPYRDYGPFTAGTVRLGNLNLEVIGARGGAGTGAGQAGGTSAGQAGAGEEAADGDVRRRQLVVLAPDSPMSLRAGLEERGIRHGEPEPFGADARNEPLYTTVDLPDLGAGHLSVQFRSYPHGAQTDTVRSADLPGVQQVDRVVLGASDVDRARGQWAAVMASGQPEPGGAWQPEPRDAWQPEYGPALELRPHGEDALIELVLRVRALATARAAFTAAGLPVTGDLVEIGTLPARLVTGEG